MLTFQDLTGKLVKLVLKKVQSVQHEGTPANTSDTITRLHRVSKIKDYK